MSEPVIRLKWVDDDIKQIELTLETPERTWACVYPPRSEGELYIFDMVIDRVNTVIQKAFGPCPANFEALNWLIGADIEKWKLVNIFIEDIPVKSKNMLTDKISKMAKEWGLSSRGDDLDNKANLFARYVVDCRSWLFDSERTIKSGDLLDINSDALELEWYMLHKDERKLSQKIEQLLGSKNADEFYRVNRIIVLINSHARIFDTKYLLKDDFEDRIMWINTNKLLRGVLWKRSKSLN